MKIEIYEQKILMDLNRKLLNSMLKWGWKIQLIPFQDYRGRFKDGRKVYLVSVMKDGNFNIIREKSKTISPSWHPSWFEYFIIKKQKIKFWHTQINL